MKSRFFVVMREVVGDSSRQFDMPIEDFAALFTYGENHYNDKHGRHAMRQAIRFDPPENEDAVK